jgi:repressor LexA
MPQPCDSNLLTEKQRKILSYIQQVQKEEGVPPTLKEIATFCGYSSINSVRQHLKLMQKKGCLELVSGRARGIKLTASDSSESLPILGCVAAGKPMWAEENRLGQLNLSNCFGPASRLFVLRVEGESMKNAGILSGDLAILEKCESLPSGAIGVFRIGDDATLKRIIFNTGQVILRAENPSYPDRILSPNEAAELHIEGRLRGVVRCVLERKDI